MKKLLLLFSCLFINILCVKAQELNATVVINTPKLANADPKIFVTLKSQISEFLNSQKWTEDIYDNNERINVNVNITIIEERSPTSFTAKINLQATRPVFGSDYETTIFNHADDDFEFTYEQFQPIQYTRNSYNDNISGVFSFYAFYILGLDYDTYSPFGGEQFFLAAQEVQRLAPQGGGWVPGRSTRNRYWMMENVLNPRMRGFREAMYLYHRQGLDAFSTNPEDAKIRYVQSLDDINKSMAAYPNAMIISMFNNAKQNEIIEIGKGLNRGQKAKVFEVMVKVDPANMSKYQNIGLNF